MKHESISVSRWIPFKSVLVTLLVGVSFASWSQIITTFAGKATAGKTGDGGQATAAQLSEPFNVAVDASGNVYIADWNNNRVQKVNTAGVITTFAGTGTNKYYGDGGLATAAEIHNPSGIAVDASGNVYISDQSNDLIRKVNTSGVISTFAGLVISGTPPTAGHSGYNGDGGPATAADLFLPSDVAVDVSGNVYVADTYNERIRVINTSGTINTIAGNGSGGYTGDTGPATAAKLHLPYGVSLDATGNIYIADGDNNAIRMVNTSGIINTVAGNGYGAPGGGGYSGDGGAATAAELYTPYSMAVDAHGNMYIADDYNSLVRIVNTSGLITTFAGIASGAEAETNEGYSGDGGPATAADINSAQGVTVDASGNVYIADTYNSRVRKATISPLSVSGNVTVNITCNEASTGSASATPSGGVVPFTYSWAPGGQSTSSITGLSAGTYTITVTDFVSNTATNTVTITQPDALIASTSALSGAGCGGGTKGSASVTAGGGTTPYTYSWSPGGQTNSIATGLSAGIYTITVQDNCGALVTDSVNVQPLTVIAFAGANVSCYGGSNGQVKVSASGGKVPFTYSWSPIANSTYIANGLSVGSYSVLVTDFNGCSGTSTATITQPTALMDSVATVSYPSCVMPTGSATIGVQGGTSPYRYTWSPNISTTNSATGLLVRSYAVQVKDNNSCWNTLNFSISQPPLLRDSIVKGSVINASPCGSNGGATVGVKYGTSPYTYSWSPAGGSGSTANGLSAGTYTVTVNDAGLCTASTSVTIIQVIRPSLLATAYTGGNVSCNGGSNGQAKVSVTGGSIPYTYSWNSGSNTYIANGLSTGTYTVTVTDNCGSSASSSATVNQPALLVDSVASITYPPCPGEEAGGIASPIPIGGTAVVGVIGGTSPYRYTWSPNVSSTDSASGLTTRSYVVQVKDNNNCWNNITIDLSCSDRPAATYSKGIHSDKGNNATCCPVSDNINLYPNPNTGQFTLSGLQKGMILEMYDYTGKKISATTTTNQTMQLNISQAEGVYLIRILDKDGNLVTEKKVVKMQ